MKSSERHKLKEDSYGRTLEWLAQWIAAHKQPVILGAVAIAAAAALLIVWTYTHQAREQEAQTRLTEARSKARGILWQEEKEKSGTANDVVALCDGIVADHPGSAAAPLALLQAAQALNEVGRAKDAVTYFRKALDRSASRPDLAVTARWGLAQALEASGDTAGAIAEYDRLMSGEPGIASARAAWDLGRCYELLGDRTKAVESYRKASERGAASSWARLAASRVQSLTAPPPSGAAASPAPPPASSEEPPTGNPG